MQLEIFEEFCCREQPFLHTSLALEVDRCGEVDDCSELSDDHEEIII